MRSSTKLSTLAITIISLIFLLSVSVAAQKKSHAILPPDPIPVPVMYPYDFSDMYYKENGIDPSMIISRRTGDDGQSVFDVPIGPNFNEIRVIATIPAYTYNGEVSFWYPLGELSPAAFLDDRGAKAMEEAKMFPIYVFPDRRIAELHSYALSRQAPIIDNLWSVIADTTMNPLGIRAIIIVNYTGKAFDDQSVPVMNYFLKKNGTSIDGTPIIKSLDDIRYLERRGLITLEDLTSGRIIGPMGQYAISPVIADPTNGVIARDAYLWMVTENGNSLFDENLFEQQFNCLKKMQKWCEF